MSLQLIVRGATVSGSQLPCLSKATACEQECAPPWRRSFASSRHGRIASRQTTRKSRSLCVRASQQPPNTQMQPQPDETYQQPVPSFAGSTGTAAANLEYLLERSAERRRHTEQEDKLQRIESWIERKIFDCRFFTLMAVVGSLAGSLLCFTKGCLFVVQAFREYFRTCLVNLGTGKVILLLVEAVDVYLVGTVMLIFGMGLYELFVSALEVPGETCNVNNEHRAGCGSNFFGLFSLTERPRWLEITSLDELKTKLGHVIVMILLVGMFEKSKKVPIHSANDLLAFSLSILLASGALFLLSKLHNNGPRHPSGSTQ